MRFVIHSLDVFFFFFYLIAIFLATVHFWMSKLSIFVILLLAWNCLLYILGNFNWYKKTCSCKYLSLDLWLHSYYFTNFMFLLRLKYAEEIAEIAYMLKIGQSIKLGTIILYLFFFFLLFLVRLFSFSGS